MRQLIITTALVALNLWASVAVHAQNSQQTNSNVKAPDLAAIADQVHTGRLPCELGQSVTIEVDRRSPTQFYLDFKNERYHLTPVKTSTGAIRLEDESNGIVWIQLSNKSMLMNSKLGQRQADECKSPTQVAVSEAMKSAPPINILEPSPSSPRK